MGGTLADKNHGSDKIVHYETYVLVEVVGDNRLDSLAYDNLKEIFEAWRLVMVGPTTQRGPVDNHFAH